MGMCKQGLRSTTLQQINFDSLCPADWLILCEKWSSAGMLWVTPGGCSGAQQAQQTCVMGKHCLSLDACFTSGPDVSSPSLKLITVIQMTAALLDCHSHHHREYSCCDWQLYGRDGDWSTVPAPFQHGGTLPLGEQAEALVLAVSNARREQNCLVHTVCVPLACSSSPCSRCFPGCLHVQSVPVGTADEMRFQFTPVPARSCTFQCFYSHVAGLPAREGGDGAELPV